MKRTLMFVETPDNDVVVAQFILRDGVVHAEYTDHELEGIISQWVIKPSDGMAFLSELDRVFGNSSRYFMKS